MAVDKEVLEQLKKKKHYIILSTVTKKPYLDESGACIITEDMEDAKFYTENIPNTYISDKSDFVRINIIILYGADTLIYKGSKQKVQTYALDQKDMSPIEYLNSRCNFLIHQLMQTNKKKYLKELKDIPILCPISIDERQYAKYSYVHYSIGLLNNRQHLILFSSIQEFEEWNNTQKNIWKPLETTIFKIEHERRNAGICINPLTDKLILSDKLLKDVLRE